MKNPDCIIAMSAPPQARSAVHHALGDGMNFQMEVDCLY